MLIVDVAEGETEQQAMQRVEAERLAARPSTILSFEQAEQVMREEVAARSAETEMRRVAAEPGAELRPPEPNYIDADDEAVRDGWEIRDLSALDWALSRVADLEAERAENEELREQALARVNARADKLNATVDRGLAFFKSHIAAYAMSHRAELLKGGKKKSRALPHGVIAYRKTGGGYEVTDEAALLEWARIQPAEAEVLRIREEPALANIKKHVETTGEVPPGLEERPVGEEIQIKSVEG